MSISIFNAALHKIDVNHNGETELTLNNTTLQTTASVEYVTEKLVRNYCGRAKKFAAFTNEDPLITHDTIRDNFLDITLEFATRFHEQLTRYPFAEGGLLFIVHYMHLATECVMAAFLPQSQYPIVDDELVIGGTKVLHLEGLTIAALVDLSQMQSAPEKEAYISFLSQNSRKYGDFWLDVLEAHIGLEPRIQNQVLVQAIHDFVSESKDLDDYEKHAVKKAAFKYCNDNRLAGEPIDVNELSSELLEGSIDFASYIQQNGYELTDNFPAHNAVIKRLVKFQGAGGGIRMEFDQQLLNERVFYDIETDTLTIKGTPPNLRDQLQRQLSV